MADDPAPETMVPGVHVVRAVAPQIHPDGTVALLLLEVAATPGGEASRLALTIDVKGLSAMRALIDDARGLAKARGLDTGVPPPQRPKTYEVGDSPLHRGHAFVTFDRDMPSEVMLCLADQDAMRLSEFIRTNVFGRMTPTERRTVLHREQSQPIVHPRAPKIILPGGR